MKPSSAVTFAAAIAGIFAVMMLASPAQVLEGFGAAPQAVGVVLARDVGSLYFGLFLLFILARKWRGQAQKGAILVGMITQLMAMITNSFAVMSGQLGSEAWPGVFIHLLVAVVLLAGYLKVMKESETPAIQRH
jgi:hypothetical protein